MLAIRKADGIVEYVKTPEEVRRDLLLTFLEELLKEKAEEGDEKAKSILTEIEAYEEWFKSKVKS